jgi:hypothetical protein
LDDDYAYERAKIVWECYGWYSVLYLAISRSRKTYLQEFVEKQKYEVVDLQVEKVTRYSQWLMPRIILISQEIENDVYLHTKDEDVPDEIVTLDFFYNLKVKVKDELYFERYIKNETIDTVEKYVEYISREYDKFIFSKLCRKKTNANKTIADKSKQCVRAVMKHRIGHEERAVLSTQYKFASSYYREDEIKKKELFILKRYMDEMVQMGNTVNIDQTKFERFNELIKVGEQ